MLRAIYRFLAGLVLPVLVVGGCGGGGGGAEAGGGNLPVAGGLNNPQPLAVGDRWIYSASDGNFELVSVDAQRTVRGTLAAAVVTKVLGARGAGPEEALVAQNGDALVELAEDGDPVSLALGNVVLLPLPLPTQPRAAVRLMDRTVAAGYDFDDDGRPDAMAVTVDQEVLASENISVPAGSFAQAAHVRTVIRLVVTLSTNGSIQTSISTVDEWYAQDIGLLRDSVSTVVGTVRSDRTRNLTGYRVAGRSSDLAAPAIVARVPASDSTLVRLFDLSVQFDEPIDPSTFNSSSVLLKDAAGRVVAGNLALIDATRASLTLTEFLPTGAYTVTVAATLADWWGNTRPAQQWSLVIDASGPTVVRSTPAAGAVDVALNGPFELVFDEPFDPATVSASTVQLRDQFRFEIPTLLTVVDTRTVRLQPLQPLQAGQLHVLWVGLNLQDRRGIGNANSVEVSFRTVQGLLGYPVQVSPGLELGRSTAVADYTGDGLPDVLDLPGSSTTAVRVHPRLPGGGLGAARLLPLPDAANCGNAGIMQAAEMNGDARLDVVVTRTVSRCGIQVLAQGLDGQLSLVADLTSPEEVVNFALADLDGNGRLDVVASQYGNDTITVWMQTSPGVFTAGRDFAGIDNWQGRLVVGDVNGDGRPDLVMTSGRLYPVPVLVVLLQQADGSFGPRQSYPLASAEGGAALILADLNGDGRTDIVVQLPGLGDVWIFRQAADGSLEAPRVLASQFPGGEIVAADLDGDGRVDIATSSGSVAVYLQLADGGFRGARQYASSFLGGGRLAALDVTADGRLDLVLDGPFYLPNLGATPGSNIAPGPAFAGSPGLAANAGTQALGNAGVRSAWANRLRNLLRAPTKGGDATGLVGGVIPPLSSAEASW